jgi:hypothetical protein
MQPLARNETFRARGPDRTATLGGIRRLQFLGLERNKNIEAPRFNFSTLRP